MTLSHNAYTILQQLPRLPSALSHSLNELILHGSDESYEVSQAVQHAVYRGETMWEKGNHARFIDLYNANQETGYAPNPHCLTSWRLAMTGPAIIEHSVRLIGVPALVDNPASEGPFSGSVLVEIFFGYLGLCWKQNQSEAVDWMNRFTDEQYYVYQSALLATLWDLDLPMRRDYFDSVFVCMDRELDGYTLVFAAHRPTTEDQATVRNVLRLYRPI